MSIFTYLLGLPYYFPHETLSFLILGWAIQYFYQGPLKYILVPYTVLWCIFVSINIFKWWKKWGQEDKSHIHDLIVEQYGIETFSIIDSFLIDGEEPQFAIQHLQRISCQLTKSSMANVVPSCTSIHEFIANVPIKDENERNLLVEIHITTLADTLKLYRYLYGGDVTQYSSLDDILTKRKLTHHIN